jgi:hypothetical protein
MTYFLLIPIFAILDRWCGGGMGWNYKFRGRPIYYILPLIPVAWLIDWRLSVILTGWVVWREPKWALFGGSLAPTGRKEILGTFYRHLLILPVFLATVWASTANQYLAVGLLILWAASATNLAVVNRRRADQGEDANGAVEFIRGISFGIVAFAIMRMA